VVTGLNLKYEIKIRLKNIDKTCVTQMKNCMKSARSIVDDHRIVSRYHFVRVLETLVRCRYAVQLLDVIFNRNSCHDSRRHYICEYNRVF